jgi:hypothetical protein
MAHDPHAGHEHFPCSCGKMFHSRQELADHARLADLVHLDVLDLRLDGTYVMSRTFLADAREAYRQDPSAFDTIVGDLILTRALHRGYAVLDVDDLALLALEIAANEAEA